MHLFCLVSVAFLINDQVFGVTASSEIPVATSSHNMKILSLLTLCNNQHSVSLRCQMLLVFITVYHQKWLDVFITLEKKFFQNQKKNRQKDSICCTQMFS